MAPDEVRSLASGGLKEAGSPLPYLETIQRAFGRHDIRSVVTQIGGSAAQTGPKIGARAFAQGERIGFVASPDLFTAAHEAAHVVQQRAGKTPPSGVGAEGDEFERHADEVANAVVAGKSAEHILDRMVAGATTVDSIVVVQRAPSGWRVLDQIVPGMGEAGEFAAKHSGQQQLIADLTSSILRSPQFIESILSEQLPLTPQQLTLLVQAAATFAAAEIAVVTLLALPDPTFVSKVVAFVLQALILAFAVHGAVTEGIAATTAAREWWAVCKNAKGRPEEVAKASSLFAKVVVHLILAVIASVGGALAALRGVRIPQGSAPHSIAGKTPTGKSPKNTPFESGRVVSKPFANPRVGTAAATAGIEEGVLTKAQIALLDDIDAALSSGNIHSAIRVSDELVATGVPRAKVATFESSLAEIHKTTSPQAYRQLQAILPDGTPTAPSAYGGPLFHGTDIPPEIAFQKGFPARGSNT